MNDENLLAKVGDASHLPAPEARDESGRFTSARAARGREIALRIIEDKDYQDELAVRARAGTLPPAVEVHLWKMAYGEPPKDDQEAEEAKRRYAEMREMVRALARSAQAHSLEAAVVGAKRVLPMPRLIAPPAPEPSDPDVDS